MWAFCQTLLNSRGQSASHQGKRPCLTRGPCQTPGMEPPDCLLPRYQLQPDGSLVISPVAVEDGGFYACVAFNGQDRDQRWVQLRVLGKGAVLSGRVSGASGL